MDDRYLRAVGPACLAAGIAFLVLALAGGGAGWFVVLVFPVLTGSSPLFLAAVALLFLGILLLPLGWGEPVGASRPAARPAGSDSPSAPGSGGGSGSGGVILVGPFPIFFGSWRPASRATYRWAVLVGAGLLVAAIALFVVLR